MPSLDRHPRPRG